MSMSWALMVTLFNTIANLHLSYIILFILSAAYHASSIILSPASSSQPSPLIHSFVNLLANMNPLQVINQSIARPYCALSQGTVRIEGHKNNLSNYL